MSASREKKSRQSDPTQGLTQKERKELQEQQAAKRKAVVYTVIGVIVAVLVAALLIWHSGIFQRGNFYAITAIAGATSYVALVENFHAPNIFALVVCVVITMALRWISLHYNILTPTEVNLDRVARPIRQFGNKAVEAVSKPVHRVPSERALDERRERVQADIKQRRREERKRQVAQKRRAFWEKHC